VSHFPERDDPPTIIPVSVQTSHPILSPGIPPVWFSGVPQALGVNPLLIPILSAPAESFAADSASDSGAEAVVDASEKGGEGLWAGSSLKLVTGFQARSGARATWVGGVEMFSDAFAKKEVSQYVLPMTSLPYLMISIQWHGIR
jgi:oligosaccharyltransferase complex subunit beta